LHANLSYVQSVQAAFVTFNRMSEAQACLQYTPNPGFLGKKQKMKNDNHNFPAHMHATFDVDPWSMPSPTR